MGRDFNRKGIAKACIKVDLKKAFDTVNRDFVYHIMHCMGFHMKWIQWMRECIGTPTFSIMLNGSPSGYITSNRGIRQGDSLSPYIFVLVIEFFSIQMEIFAAFGKFKPIKRTPGGGVIAHLLFADDMLIFTKSNACSIKAEDSLLDLLSINTGLSINKERSKIFFSKGCKRKEGVKKVIGIGEGKLPVKYLGMPLSVTIYK